MTKVTPAVAMYGEIGWIPPVIRQKVECVKYWHRLCSMDKERIISDVFNMDYATSMLGAQSWCSDLKKIFVECDLEDIYLTRDVSMYSSQSLASTVQDRLVHTYIEGWQQSLPDYSRLQVYSTVKNSYTREDYLLKCSRVNRSVIAKLRMGVFPLQVKRTLQKYPP